VTLNLAKTSVVKSRPSVLHGANLFGSWHLHFSCRITDHYVCTIYTFVFLLLFSGASCACESVLLLGNKILVQMEYT